MEAIQKAAGLSRLFWKKSELKKKKKQTANHHQQKTAQTNVNWNVPKQDHGKGNQLAESRVLAATSK